MKLKSFYSWVLGSWVLGLAVAFTPSVNAFSSAPAQSETQNSDEMNEDPAALISELGLDEVEATMDWDTFFQAAPSRLKQKGAEAKTWAEIVIVINKAKAGPSAQTMTVYHHGIEVARYLVSTGREQMEKAKSGRRYFSATPIGYFRPTRVVKKHFSNTWKVNLHHVVFFIGGIALHATEPELYRKLGTRASGGCVRLTQENAKTVYDWITELPVKRVQSVSREGSLLRTTELNRDVLIIVEND